MKYTYIIFLLLTSMAVQSQTPYLHSKRSSNSEVQASIDKHLSLAQVKAIRLLEIGKYSELIDLITSLEASFNENIANEVPLSLEIYSIYYSEKNLGDKLDKFVQAYPDHFLPYLLRGTFYVGQGWNNRGGSYYDDTTKQQVRGMDYFHLKAFPDLNQSLVINPNFMYSYLIRAAIYRPRGAAKDLMWEDIRTALDLNEASYEAWTQYLNASLPRWYGSEYILHSRLNESQRYVKANPRLVGMKALVARNNAEKYWYAKQKKKAIKAYIDAEKLGDHEWVTSETARVLLYSGKDNDLACEYTDKAIKLEPYSPRTNRFALYCEANRKLGYIK